MCVGGMSRLLEVVMSGQEAVMAVGGAPGAMLERGVVSELVDYGARDAVVRWRKRAPEAARVGSAPGVWLPTLEATARLVRATVRQRALVRGLG